MVNPGFVVSKRASPVAFTPAMDCSCFKESLSFPRTRLLKMTVLLVPSLFRMMICPEAEALVLGVSANDTPAATNQHATTAAARADQGRGRTGFMGLKNMPPCGRSQARGWAGAGWFSSPAPGSSSAPEAGVSPEPRRFAAVMEKGELGQR